MKFIVVRRKTLLLAGAVLVFAAAAAVLITVLGNAAVNASASGRLIPIYGVDRQDKYVSLTFDAAWGNEDTQNLIDILHRYKVNATFFVVGKWVDKYPESVKALAQAGNEVMNHSNSHPHMPQLSRSAMLEEINACDDKIQKVTGVRPTLFRPPYGDYNNALIETLNSVHHYCIQWTVDTLEI